MNATNSNETAEAEELEYLPPNGTFYFSHSEAVLPLLSLLGINEDGLVLTHSNFEQVQERKYRVSKMSPFSANVGFLLMECEAVPLKRVMTLVQEKPVQLPQCDRIDCDWDKFKMIYKVTYNLTLKIIIYPSNET